jgi:predicted PurR-regulated permease PerM
MAQYSAHGRAGLNPRANVGGDHVQIRVDPGTSFDYDSEVEGLRAGVSKLKSMATFIHEETQQQSALLKDLGEAMERAQSALRSNVRRLKKVYKEASARHMVYLVLFCFLVIVLLYGMRKMFRLGIFIFGHHH